MARQVHPLVAFGANLILDHFGLNQRRGPYSGYPELAEIPPVRRLMQMEGDVIPIIGAPYTGKTILARRLAEILGRPTFAVSPKERPPSWIKRIQLDDVIDPEKVPKLSTVILDDVLLYASTSDYKDPLVEKLEKIIPVARHERKVILIFCSQTSSLTDRHLFLGPCIFLKKPSLLFVDTERDGVKRLYQRAEEYFEGKSEKWLQRHAYCVGHTFEGLVSVALPHRPQLPNTAIVQRQD